MPTRVKVVVMLVLLLARMHMVTLCCWAATKATWCRSVHSSLIALMTTIGRADGLMALQYDRIQLTSGRICHYCRDSV